MWGAPQKVGKWICFKSSCLGWGDGEAADMLSGILPSLQEHLELKALLPGEWAACSFLWPAAFSRVSLQVTHTRIAMLTRGASNSRYNTTIQKLKDLPQDPVSSRLRTGLSLWTWQDWHTTPPPSIPSRIANEAAQPSLLDALNKGPKDLLPLHRRSYLSSLYLTFLSFCWHDILPVLFLMNLKIIVSQVSGLVCFWTLSVTFAVRKRKRMQGRTLGRGKRGTPGDDGVLKASSDTTVPNAQAQVMPLSLHFKEPLRTVRILHALPHCRFRASPL